MKLVNNIKQHRRELNFSQQVMAERTGISRQHLINIELGKAIPSFFVALKIAYVFESSPSDIFYLDRNEKSQLDKRLGKPCDPEFDWYLDRELNPKNEFYKYRKNLKHLAIKKQW